MKEQPLLKLRINAGAIHQPIAEVRESSQHFEHVYTKDGCWIFEEVSMSTSQRKERSPDFYSRLQNAGFNTREDWTDDMIVSEQFDRPSEDIRIGIMEHLSGPPESVWQADIVRILNGTQWSLKVSNHVVE
jgi:hypothetical protein